MNAQPPKIEAPTCPHVMNTYGRLPIALSHGQGCRVWDVHGREYLDALAGIAVNTLGHNHPKLAPAALKLARKFGHNKGIERPEIVVYENAFHGRSIATLSATGNPKVQAGFGPLLEGFIRVPLNDMDALRQATEGNSNVAAVFFEAIQGEGGVHPVHTDYLRQVRALCDERDW
ncbi:MAG: aminotransferase class III-fold pyridoxal phosphate-dependent enzyme, partial [Betaproteobacteria bacterium]|nr:aminotransferase class III-fold pyridoxal phosphate-dependent enzyme [Betaproteobacteria bacterium]